jgi:H+/Cl- antiporter ClcA
MSIMATRFRRRDAESRTTDSTETNLAVVAICAIVGMIVMALLVAFDLGGEIFQGILG